MNTEIIPGRARCPLCGIPTVPDREDLTYEEMLCDACYELVFLEDN
jgi:formylmethanofuran dehydrogenase subunit E